MPILGVPTNEPTPTEPSHFSLERIIRPNILSLVPYRSARDDYDSGILLDANENALGPVLPALLRAYQEGTGGKEGEAMPIRKEEGFAKDIQGVNESGTKVNGASSSSSSSSTSSDDLSNPLMNMTTSQLASLNRYPSPTHDPLKRLIAQHRGLPSPNWVFLGVGSDEVIDLLFRVSCVPGKDVVITTPPTYGMYGVTANVNDVGVVEVPLITEQGKFEVDIDSLEQAFISNPNAKLLFLCSPGNPTGTLIPLPIVRRIATNPNFKGIVVVDEAYIDFAPDPSRDTAAGLVKEFANVCVSQTLSKGFGLAGIRLGFALASPPLVQIMTNTKAPYNISVPTATLALTAFTPSGISLLASHTQRLLRNRDTLITRLTSGEIKSIGKILGGNHANFILVQILDEQGVRSNDRAKMVYKTLAEELGVVVRFRGMEKGCEGCLRITVGSEEEVEVLLKRMKEILG